jgi:hypothetical protein
MISVKSEETKETDVQQVESTECASETETTVKIEGERGHERDLKLIVLVVRLYPSIEVVEYFVYGDFHR